MSSSAPDVPRQTYSGIPGYPPGAQPQQLAASPPGPVVVAEPGVPAPPPGPGVTPPFPAPPIEGRATRMWLGLGAAGLAMVLCCGGGLAAIIGLSITGVRAINEQAHVVVGDYLDDVRAERYAEAYGALCPSLRARESARQFERRVADEPKIASYDMGDVSLTGDITLPVEVDYFGGASETLRFLLEQDTGTGEFEVCGIER